MLETKQSTIQGYMKGQFDENNNTKLICPGTDCTDIRLGDIMRLIGDNLVFEVQQMPSTESCSKIQGFVVLEDHNGNFSTLKTISAEDRDDNKCIFDWTRLDFNEILSDE